jgi:predicted dehydrogenase
MSTLRVGVIGYGYWGPNIVRNLFALDSCAVVALCDKNPGALQKARKVYPSLTVTTNPNEVICSPQVDAVAIVTPVWTHYELARTALENGKHVFVEKPFTSTVAQAEELVEMAARRGLQIMVDHTFLFTGAVKKIRELVDNGTLGPLIYFDSSRINLGLFQHDVSVIWDLAPHDLAIMDYVIREKAEAVVATGATHFGSHADMAFLTIYFPNNVLAHVNVNWLSPVKVRTTMIGGRDKMLVWNDLEADEKIRVYDKGVTVTNKEGVYDLLVSYRSGDVWAPKCDSTEALKAELGYFAECVANNRKPFNDGEAGLRVVRILQAADKSLAERGRAIEL